MHGNGNLHTLALSQRSTSFSSSIITAVLVGTVMAPRPKACFGQCALRGKALYP